MGPNTRATVKTFIQGNRWPAVASAGAAEMLAMLYQLEQTEWMPANAIEEQQCLQARILIEHAHTTVPYYREKMQHFPSDAIDSFTMGQLRQLPVLSRQDIQGAGNSLISQNIPKAHGKITKTSSSGSTGRPVTCLTTEITRFFWRLLTLRESLWHKRDFSGKLAVIRPEVKLEPGQEICAKGWGHATNSVYNTGPMVAMSIRTDIKTQAEWLHRHNPHYLISLPSNLVALAEQCRKSDLALPALKEIRAIGEVCDEDVRMACRETWDCPVTDIYSATETGYLALQCPQHGGYHVQSESVLLEVVNDKGHPCQPGETGMVLVTSLHNFAMPLIRYAVGDYAEVGAPCPCGRGLPVIKRVLGRQRNMLTLPDGNKSWPSFPASLWESIGGIRQLQLIQQSLGEIEVNYVAARDLSKAEQQEFTEKLSERFGARFAFRFVRHSQINRSASGKYEDFISLVKN